MRKRLLRSSPLRTALVLGSTVLVSLLIAGIVALQLIQAELSRRMDGTLAETFQVISQTFAGGDQTDLLDSVRSHAVASLANQAIFALSDVNGQVLAGNVRAMPTALGWVTLPGASLGLADKSQNYRVFVGAVADNHLLVGESFAEVSAIGRLALTSLASAGVVILVLLAVAGVAVAIHAQRRIDSIAQVMDRVSRGELTARIVARKNGDDIDILSGQVNAALERLAALVEGMRQVSMNIAHDLKTPLNRLSIAIDDIARSVSEGRPLEAPLAQATHETQQIGATFDALLRIAQIEAGARRERFQPVDLTSILEVISDAYIDVAEENGQRLAVSDGPSLPPVEGDRELLVQLCANLVENAIRHCPPATQIELTASLEGGAVQLCCSDDGPGIPEAERAHVFEPFYRIDKSRTTTGSGLGLSLVKAIVELHDATIQVDDNGPGLKVQVRFPCAPPQTRLPSTGPDKVQRDRPWRRGSAEAPLERDPNPRLRQLAP